MHSWQTMEAANKAGNGKRHKKSWTSAKKTRLIGLYQNYRLLWDHRHPDYYKRDQRMRAMRAIADSMGNEFHVVNVKDKIKTLRDYFVKELKKEEGSRTSSCAYPSRWEHFNCWQFLRGTVNVGTSSLSSGAAAMSYLRTLPQQDNHVDSSTDSRSQLCATRTSPSSVTAACTSASTSAVTGNHAGPSTCAPNVAHLDRHDGETLFSQQVATELREMKKYQRDLAKLRIQQVLFDVKHTSQAHAVGTSEDLPPIQPMNVAVVSQLGQIAASIPTVVSASHSREGPLCSKGPRHPAFEKVIPSV